MNARVVLLHAIVFAFCGCAATLAVTYADELDRCIAKGEQAHSVARYERCAAAVDRWLCETRDHRCVDAGAP